MKKRLTLYDICFYHVKLESHRSMPLFPSPPTPPAPTGFVSKLGNATYTFDHPLEKRVFDQLIKLGVIGHEVCPHLLVAYSGGRDSSALMGILTKIRAKFQCRLTAVYFDHGWRERPPAEIQRIQKNCEKWKVPWVWIPPDLTQPKTEAAGRHSRYPEMIRLAEDLQANALLTAHHADDQLETLVFRMFRGTGIEGMKGIQSVMTWGKSHIPIVRPMLEVLRKDLEDYLTQFEIRYFDDPSNQDFRHARNAIRHQVLPVIEKQFPNYRAAFQRLSTLIEGDLTILDDVIDPLWRNLTAPDRSDRTSDPAIATANGVRGSRSLDQVPAVMMQIAPFNQLGLPYQRRIMRRFLAHYGFLSDFVSVEDAIRFVTGETRSVDGTALKSMGQDPQTGKARYFVISKDMLTVKTLDPSQLLGPFAPPYQDPTPWKIPEEELITALEALEAHTAHPTPAPAPMYQTDDNNSDLMEEDGAQSTPTSENSEDGDSTDSPPLVSNVIQFPKAMVTELSDEELKAKFGYQVVFPRQMPGSCTIPQLAPGGPRAVFTIQPIRDEDWEDWTAWPPENGLMLAVNMAEILESGRPMGFRARQPGDRIHPLGMPGPMRLKKYLINREVPRFEREGIPLLMVENEVLWVPGVGLAHPLRIQVEPTHLLTMVLAWD